MDTFYLIVLSIAVVLLIIILTIVGLMMRSNAQTEVFPPILNTCPDLWSIDGSGNCTIVNDKNRGSYMVTNTYGANDAPGHVQGSNTINFEDPKWSGFKGKTAICAKRDWANTYGITWDGVANYNSC